MSKASELFKTASEHVQAVAPGLSLSNILHDLGGELKQQVAAGSHEIASALFNGSAFVMYPRTGNDQKEDQQQGVEPAKEQEQSRGMEM